MMSDSTGIINPQLLQESRSASVPSIDVFFSPLDGTTKAAVREIGNTKQVVLRPRTFHGHGFER
jgi:hypothetical protein